MEISAVYFIIFLVSVFVSSVSQVVLKTSAKKEYQDRLHEYMNPRVIIAYGMFFLSTIAGVVAYRGVPLSLGAVLESTGYIWVTVLGFLFLKERLNKKKVLGICCILVGIIVFNL